MAASRQDNRVPPPSSLLSAYSDASSSYWPPGWNFDRYAHATAEDNAALPDDERAKMQAGFRDVLGEDGVAEMARVLWQEQLRVKKLEEAASLSSLPSSSAQGQRRRLPPPPDWLKTWRKRYRGQPWGFVAFRTATATATIMTNSDVEEFQTRVREIVEIPLDAALEQGQPADEVAEARSTFEIRWVEVEEEEPEETTAEEGHSRHDIVVADPVERLRARYRAMRESGSLPPGLSLPIFLCASPGAVTSVLSTSPGGDNNGKKPETMSPRWRPGAPFLLAVAAEEERGPADDEADDSVGGGGEKDWFKPVFKVAAEVLVEELWWVVEEQITSLGKLMRFVRGAAVTDDPTVAEEKEKEGERRPGGGHGHHDDDKQGEEPGHDDDGLDDIWWSVHMPPHRMRKRRRMFASE
ncbi:hypothetical protein DL769_008157 [Monosporascus sp. CRB-8-3]|nr:hypothetical protein DL769_008157 [Monosporascus sp. CRB-8-3]